MPIDIRVIAFGERGFPVRDLTANTKDTEGKESFRIGKFDFPCIAVADIAKYNMAIVVNRMEMPSHKYHGFLIVAPLLNRITAYGLTHSYDDTEVNASLSTYVLKKTITIHTLDVKKITAIHYEAKYLRTGTGGTGEGLKVTYEIDGGTETTLFEKLTSFELDYEWIIESCSLEGKLIILRLYLKWGGSGANVDKPYNRGFKVHGNTLLEISGEKFTVDNPELI